MPTTAPAAAIRANIRRANLRAMLEDISFDEASTRNAVETGQNRKLVSALAISCVLLGMSTALHYLR